MSKDMNPSILAFRAALLADNSYVTKQHPDCKIHNHRLVSIKERSHGAYSMLEAFCTSHDTFYYIYNGEYNTPNASVLTEIEMTTTNQQEVRK